MAINQFLTFTLAEELYAVEVAQVQEVLSEMPLTVIPRMPDYMQGVINIRGFGKKDERFVIILDINQVFQAEAKGRAAVQDAPVAQESVVD